MNFNYDFGYYLGGSNPPDEVYVYLNNSYFTHYDANGRYIFTDCEGEDLSNFISEMCATEFHEIGHCLNPHSACVDYNRCRCHTCRWCNFTDRLRNFFKSVIDI